MGAIDTLDTFKVKTGSGSLFDGMRIDGEDWISTPTLADLDNDGDLDAVVGDYDGELDYFENTGSADEPVFVQRMGTDNPFEGLVTGQLSDPALGDVDADGDLDAVVGDDYGELRYFENTGSADEPVFVERTEANPFEQLGATYYSSPELADLDADGDLDLVLGSYDGTLRYYENTGDGYVEAVGTENPFNGIDVEGNMEYENMGYAKPALGDMDGDGDLDLVAGEVYGSLKYYENIGNSTTPLFVGLTGSDNPFNEIDVGYWAAPAVGDLNNDGKAEVIVGNDWGTLLTLGPNDAPVAVKDSYVVAEDAVLEVAKGDGVLFNDTDVDLGDKENLFSAIVVTDPEHGQLTLNKDGSFTYTPDPDYSGADSFTYQTSDGTALSEPVTVTLDVTPVNDAPVANDDPLTATEDTEVTFAAQDLIGNDADVDTDQLTIAKVISGANGTAVLNEDGTVTFKPNHNFHGQADFTYTVNDGTASSNEATVTVDVASVDDGPPELNARIEFQSTAEASPFAFTIPEGTFVDPDGDPMTYQARLVDNDGNLVDLPEWLSFDAATTTFTGTPQIDEVLYIRVDATDAFGGNTFDFFELTVTPTNDAPVAEVDELWAVEDTEKTYTASRLLNNDTDEEGNTLIIAGVESGTGGTVVLNDDGTVTFTPKSDFHGQADFTYTVSDGTDTSAPVQVIVNVTPVNDAPVAVDDTLKAEEDTPVTFTAADLLGNDTDVDNDKLTIASVTSGSGGTVVLNEDGTVTFKPDADFNGDAEFTYTISDGTETSVEAKAKVEVAPVNDVPVAAEDEFATDEDTPITFTAADLLGNDADVENDELAIAGVTSGIGGIAVLNEDGTVTFKPDADFNGKAEFTYTVTDGTDTSLEAKVEVAVAPVNDVPIAVEDKLATEEDTPVTFTAADLLGNDTDVEKDGLTIAGVTSGIGGTVVLNEDGTVTFTPDPDFNGKAEFTYTVTDGTDTSIEAKVEVAVAPVNDAPIATDDAPEFNAAPGIEATGNVLTNDTDIDVGDQLRVTAVRTGGIEDSGTAGEVGLALTGSYGSLLLNKDGSYTYAVDATNPTVQALSRNATLQDTFNYTVDDGQGGTDMAVLTVTFNGPNHAPVLVRTIPDLTVTEDAAMLAYTVPAGPTNRIFRDADSDKLTYSASLVDGSELPPWLHFDAATRKFSGTPDDSGQIEVRVTVTDGDVTASDVFRLTITPVNDAPVAEDLSGEAVEDGPATELKAAFFDQDKGDTHTFSVDTTETLGKVVNNEDGTFSYDPNGAFEWLGEGQKVNDTFSYTVKDADGAESTMTATVTITGVNDAPEAEEIGETASEDGPAVTLTADFDDVDEGDTHTFTIDSEKTIGIVVNNEDGTFSYDPNGQFEYLADGEKATDTFTYTVTDAKGENVTRTATVTINGVNDAPALTGQPGEMPIGIEDTIYTIPTDALMSYLLEGYTDVEDQKLTAGDITVDHGSLVDNADGSWEYRPEADYSGEVKVSYVVEDEQGGEVQAELVFKLTATPDAPVVMTSLEDQVIGDGHAFEYRIQETPTFTDADTPYGDELTFTATLKDGKPLPAWLTLDAETGVFSGTPKGSDVGVLTLKVTATDKLGASVYDYVKFTVQDVENAPTGKVSLTGNIKEGYAPELAALTVDTTTLADADGLGLLAYQWQSRTEDGDWTDIGGATEESFTPNDETAGLAIRVVTSYTDGGGTLNEIASDEVLISDAHNTQQGDAAANVLTGTTVTDRIHGAAGNDVIDGLDGDDQLYGQVGRDTLRGGEGNDWLDGGLGIDNMAGGRGADTYVVDNGSDVVTEKAGSGIDTVRSSVDYKLGAFVERLVLTGTDDINGTGNSLDNRLIGNSADNVLDGGRGSDTLSGGEGNDTFRLLSDDAADMVLDFTSGSDRLALAGAGVGNGDTLLDGALELAGPGGFGTAAELVIFATDIFGDITADSAAAAIGNATEAYAVGDTRLFAVDNGQDTALYQFEAGNADAAVDAPELTLIGILQSTAQTVLADYQLV